jgi:ATP-dependent helicase/nuclease subunit B
MSFQRKQGGLILPKITTISNELTSHQAILSRLTQALQTRDFSLTVVFPTLSLLHAIQDELLNQPGINGIGGVRLLLFEGFIEEVGLQFNLNQRIPSALEREILITQCFRRLHNQGKLGYLGRVPLTGSYRQAILEGSREWKRAGFTPKMFMDWAAGRGEKEEQLALLYRNYQELLIKNGLAEEDLILAELQSISKPVEAGRKTPVILYGYTDLTPLQGEFMKTLASWFDFEVIVDPTGVTEFRNFIARHFNIQSVPAVPIREPANALAKLQDRFWTGDPEPITLDTEDQSLQLLQTSGWSRLATAVAREIVILLRENPGYGVEDFLILAPQPQRFIKAATPIFQEFNLPLAEAPASLREFPAVSRFLQSLTAISEDWQWPELVILIRQYYAGIKAEEGDRLILALGDRYGALSGRERWLNLIGNENFTLYFTELKIDTLPLVKGVSRLAEIPPAARLQDYLQLARDWFNSPEARGAGQLSVVTQAAWPQLLNYRAIQELLQAVDQMLLRIDGIAEFQNELSLLEFLRFFEDYFLAGELESANLPGPRIRVIPPREARGIKARAVFMTGLEQGSFPRVYINDWKISARDRFHLKTLGIELETGEQYQLQEKLAFYWALRTATGRLYFAYQDQDDEGQPARRSLYLDEVLQWFPALIDRKKRFHLAPRIPSGFQECCSAFEERLGWVSRLVTPSGEITAPDLEICDRFFQNPAFRGLALQIHGWRQRYSPGSSRALFSDPARRLISRKFNPEHDFGITALEDYRSCPYRFFLKHFLKIRPVPKPKVFPEGLDLGNLYHQILKEFCAQYLNTCLTREDHPEYRKTLAECFTGFYREWQENAANELVKLILFLQEELIRRNLERWLEAELRWTEESAARFRIRNLEFGIGLSRGELDPASITRPYRLESDTTKLLVWGQIDRIDADGEGNFIVYDYKSGRGPSAQDLLALKYLQIPVYLMALEQLCYGAGKAVGGSYLGLRQPLRFKGGLWRQDELRFALPGKSLLAEEDWEKWLGLVREELLTTARLIRGGEYHLTPDDCLPFCEYRDCCRRPEREVELTDGSFA